METLPAIVLVAVLILFVVIVVAVFRSSRGEKRPLSIELGFTPIEADTTLIAKITSLYQHGRSQRELELRRVAQRAMPEGTLLLFDLVDRSGEDDTWLADHAVAVISPRLNLPHFVLYPKAGQDTWLAKLGGRVVDWAVARLGEPVHFPEIPDFQQRYAAISSEPSALRRFFTTERLEWFARTRYYAVRANQDLFTFTEIDPHVGSLNHSNLTQRIDHAQQLLRLFTDATPKNKAPSPRPNHR